MTSKNIKSALPTERLKAFMERHDIKGGDDLADAAGCGRSAAYSWINGTTEAPYLARLALAAHAMGVDAPEMDAAGLRAYMDLHGYDTRQKLGEVTGTDRERVSRYLNGAAIPGTFRLALAAIANKIPPIE